VVTAGLALRKDKQLKVRQPLAAIVIPGKKFDVDLETLIKDELNVKEVRYTKTGTLDLDTAMTPELSAEGYAREAMRQIQDMRKEAGYRVDDKVFAQWHSTDPELAQALTTWTQAIMEETVLSEFVSQPLDAHRAYDIQKDSDIVLGKKVWMGLKK
jgi:isoleucyl-tRNA synthetase